MRCIAGTISKKKGQNSGLILFSHDNLKREQILPVADIFLAKKIVKKISIIQIEYQKHTKKIFEIIQTLDTKKVTKSEFTDVLSKGEYELNMGYEISKNTYF